MTIKETLQDWMSLGWNIDEAIEHQLQYPTNEYTLEQLEDAAHDMCYVVKSDTLEQ